MWGLKREQGRRGLAGAVVALTLCAAALAAPASAGARLPDGFFGIAPTAPENLTEDEYAQMGRAEIGTLRVAFFWPHIQPEPQAGDPGGDPQYDWAYTDRIVAQAAINGMRVLPFVYGTPSWAGTDIKQPPVKTERARQGWDALFRTLVARYGPNGEFWTNPDLAPEGVAPLPITDWQVWNEPNSPTYMKQKGNTARAYARTLDIAAAAIRETDPDATIVMAGMFASPKGGELFESFLDRLFKHRSVKKDFDILGVHPYAPKISKLKERINLARKAMRQHGVSAPMWVTELGWPTGGTAEGGYLQTPEGQAQMLRQSYSLLIRRQGSWGIRGIVWYTWRDNARQTDCDLCRYSGLLNRDGSPKPAWHAFLDFTGGQ